MNNKNWIAVFFGLACLVLFVSVMGASGNWMNNQNGRNNGTNPQQINETIRGMNDNTAPDNAPTKIDSNGITDTLTGDNNNNNDNTNNAKDNPTQNTPNLILPQMGQ